MSLDLWSKGQAPSFAEKLQRTVKAAQDPLAATG